MKRILLLILSAMCCMCVSAQERASYKQQEPYKNWPRMVRTLTKAFYQSDEAVRIGENVLLYQHNTGGWPKNIYIPAELDEKAKAKVLAQKNDVNESTIDNDATITEINYLAYLYNVHKDERYKQAVLAGIQYLFDAQYENGGWPQFWPRPEGYYTAITYNDGAMMNVMELLRKISEGKFPYEFTSEALREKVRQAFEKGIECILHTQVKQNEKLTVWCAQHDRETLLPTKARAYELPSLSGQESCGVVMLLMSLPNPDKRVVEAVRAAVDWFERSKVEGMKKEFFVNEEGKRDYRMVACDSDCPPLWGRFYDLDTNRPFFSDRDGVKVYDISEIGYERRNGYSWYNTKGSDVLRRYEKWTKENSVPR